MKRFSLILALLFFLFLSSCSWNQMMKWFDQMEWERDDQTIRVVDFFWR